MTEYPRHLKNRARLSAQVSSREIWTLRAKTR